MRHSKLFAWLALAAGMALSGASTLSAQDWRGIQQRRDVRNDFRDTLRDYPRYDRFDRGPVNVDLVNIDRMRADVARDQARLQEAIRCGRSGEAARIAADLARDQRALQAQMRDVRYDRRDAYSDAYNNGRNYRDTRDTRYGYR
jgi:hypothetical protein